MQTAKSLLTLLALGLCAVSVAQAGPDNEAQAKAREAVRKKIAELEGQSPAATPAKPESPTPAPKPAAPVTPKPAAPAKPPPAAPKPAAPAQPTPATTFTEPAANAKTTPDQSERLRQTVRDKIAELNTPQPAAKSAAEIRAEERAAAAEQRRQAEAEKARQKTEADEAKARAAREAAEAKAVKPPTVAHNFEPLPAPPSSIPPAKEARLADLLKKYKADEITPEQYHTERAKILAEP